MPITQLEPLRAYLLVKPGTTEERPFGPKCSHSMYKQTDHTRPLRARIHRAGVAQAM